jgi:hypothetical protein
MIIINPSLEVTNSNPLRVLSIQSVNQNIGPFQAMSTAFTGKEHTSNHQNQDVFTCVRCKRCHIKLIELSHCKCCSPRLTLNTLQNMYFSRILYSSICCQVLKKHVVLAKGLVIKQGSRSFPFLSSHMCLFFFTQEIYVSSMFMLLHYVLFICAWFGQLPSPKRPTIYQQSNLFKGLQNK